MKRQLNRYDLTGAFGVGYTSKNEIFYFDKADYNIIKDFTWYFNKYGYVVARYQIKNKRYNTFMHRLLIQAPNGQDVDHKNGNRNDNRRNNLRIVTRSQNNMNKAAKSNNTSGHIGVSWFKDCNKWRATIKVNGKQKYLGLFEKKADAIKARLDAENKFFKGFNNRR